MENAINTLRIQNFKSIKDVTLQPRRVNLIIGPPNVGKSNILEAMSLLGGMVYDKDDGRFMDGQIRYNDLRNLFYDNNLQYVIRVQSDKGGVLIDKESGLYKNPGTINVFYHNYKSSIDTSRQQFMEQINPLVSRYQNAKEKGGNEFFLHREIGDVNIVDGILDVDGIRVFDERSVFFYGKQAKVVRKYNFVKNVKFNKVGNVNYLMPPFGQNMLDVIQYNGSELRVEIANLFKPYKLNFAVRLAEHEVEIQKNEDGFVTSIPYSLIADTLQRIIFYLAAIESNDDAVILFEEPEAHSYPQYVSMLGKRIAASRNNQFFVATHSPYLLTEILEQMLPDEAQTPELAIFVAYYEDYQTKVKQLSDEEMRAIRGDSVDVFYNMNRYIPRPANG